MAEPLGPSCHGFPSLIQDSPFSQKARYSVLMEWWGPMYRRITGSVPRKLLSVAEYSSPSTADKSGSKKLGD